MENLELKPFWADRRVLVTGATGLLGSHLVRKLIDSGADAVAIVRDWVPRSELVQSSTLEEATVVRGDVTDGAFLERVLAEYEVETVFHLAAQTIVPIANRSPSSTFETNIAGTWRLLEAIRNNPTVGQTIIASSDKAYGPATTLPYSESTHLQGEHPYDVSKSCADLIAQSYAKTYGMQATTTRCGNLYGGGDLNWNRIIPGTIRSVLRSQNPVIRSDGSPKRDYFYVHDAVGAYMLLASKMGEGVDDLAFNFSNDDPKSVLEVSNEILHAMNSQLEPKVLGNATNEIQDQYLDSRLARERLGWTPGHSFQDGIRETVRWYRDALDPE